MNAVQNLAMLIGRILLSAIFVWSGVGKFMDLAGTGKYIAAAGMPSPELLAPAAALLEVVGGVLLIVGFKARWAALALAVFTAIATFYFHNFWAMPAAQQFMQKLMFMKNAGIIGGLLMVWAAGPGGMSVDKR